MARIKYSALIENIRGSIAGTTFQSNKYGFTIKAKPRMTKPNSPTQNRQKAYLSTAVKAWRELTQSVRDSWDTWSSTYPSYAKNNPAAQLSGYAVYTRQQVYRLMIGSAVYTSAPSFTLADDDTIGIALELSSGVLTLEMTSVTDDEAWDMLIFMSRPLSSAQMFTGTKTRLMNKFISNITQSADYTDEYESVFGILPSVGDRIVVDYIMIVSNNGQLISRQTQIITVAAP